MFEDIRQRVHFKMSPFEQYSLGSVFDHLPNEITSKLESISSADSKRRRQFAKEIETFAQEGYRTYQSIGGLAGEGGRAGAEGLMLLALECHSKGYSTSEAALLASDISDFRKYVHEFVTRSEYSNEPLPSPDHR